MLDGSKPPEPWLSFLTEVDGQLTKPVELNCFGGFVVIHVYGVARTTSDFDYISLINNCRLTEIAGKGSPLHKQHGVYLDAVTVATPPEKYETRLTRLYPGLWNHLRLFAMEAHDVALCKLERNYERDRDDVHRLARAGHLHSKTLSDRYYNELRPYLIGRVESHDLTLQLWMESYFDAPAL